MDTLANLKSLVAAHFGADADEIQSLDTFTALGFDSLDHAELILGVEDAFDIEISETDAAGCLTVAGLYDIILRAQGVTAD